MVFEGGGIKERMPVLVVLWICLMMSVRHDLVVSERRVVQ